MTYINEKLRSPGAAVHRDLMMSSLPLGSAPLGLILFSGRLCPPAQEDGQQQL